MSNANWPDRVVGTPRNNDEVIESWRSFIFNDTSCKSPKRLTLSYTDRGDLYSYGRRIAAVWKDAADSPNVFAVTGGSSVTTNRHTRDVANAFRDDVRFFELEDSIGNLNKKIILEYMPFITEGSGIPGTGDVSYERLIHQRSYTYLLGRIELPATRIAWAVISLAHALSYMGDAKRARSERVISFNILESRKMLDNATKILAFYETSDEKSNKLTEVVAAVKEAINLTETITALKK
ncbi:MAG: hypothetical protein E6R04_04095 [Spirochaetes bacterium]|nr:MAG: hypothetical protein E6R04_04095 [Spirochaetota bacterium]